MKINRTLCAVTLACSKVIIMYIDNLFTRVPLPSNNNNMRVFFKKNFYFYFTLMFVGLFYKSLGRCIEIASV